MTYRLQRRVTVGVIVVVVVVPPATVVLTDTVVVFCVVLVTVVQPHVGEGLQLVLVGYSFAMLLAKASRSEAANTSSSDMMSRLSSGSRPPLPEYELSGRELRMGMELDPLTCMLDYMPTNGIAYPEEVGIVDMKSAVVGVVMPLVSTIF